MAELPRVVVPQGDMGGIGPEVALRVLARPDVRRRCRPLLLGHRRSLENLVEDCGIDLALQTVSSAEAGFDCPPDGALPVVELETPPASGSAGIPAASFGMAAVESVLRGGTLCLHGRADLLLTPPIHKASMHLAGYRYEGQTQILGELCGARRYGMLACSGRLQVWVATRHMALRQFLEQLDRERLAGQIQMAHRAAREILALAAPRVVLAGLNPHAGEEGAFGDEERRILQPAIALARERWGLATEGPAVPDVVFAEGAQGRWDVVVALYHDQAFIPLKLLGRRQAYTVFVGGPILRVSPMHGCAYDIARTGQADAEPFAYALERGLELHAARARAAVS